MGLTGICVKGEKGDETKHLYLIVQQSNNILMFEFLGEVEKQFNSVYTKHKI